MGTLGGKGLKAHNTQNQNIVFSYCLLRAAGEETDPTAARSRTAWWCCTAPSPGGGPTSLVWTRTPSACPASSKSSLRCTWKEACCATRRPSTPSTCWWRILTKSLRSQDSFILTSSGKMIPSRGCWHRERLHCLE